MKKLTVLMAVILIVGLLAGCWLFPESKLISIVVEPERMFLTDPGTAFDVLSTTSAIESITACYDDWTTKEIAPVDCEYLSSNPEVAVVDIVGNEVFVRAVKAGEAIILVSYTEGKFPFKITETDIVGVFVESAE